jgi:hypothetical protein
MADFQVDVLDRLARVIGGTVSNMDPRFFSGALAGDQSGVAGLNGCYSAAPVGIEAPPVAILLPGKFNASLMDTGEEDNVDQIRLLLLVSAADTESGIAELQPYRDTVPAAFRSHMIPYGMPNSGWAFVKDGDSGVHTWGGADYYAWMFTIEVQRFMVVSYQAGPTS